MENIFYVWMTTPIPYDWAALLARLAIGLALLPYAIQKIANRHNSENFPKVLGLSSKTGFWLAMIVETSASICTIFGLWTRVAAIAGICNMGVATKTVHGKYLTATAMPYFLGFIAILFIGPGRFSLDWLLM